MGEFKGTKGKWMFKNNLPEYLGPKCIRIEVYSQQNTSFWICKVQNNGMIGKEEGEYNALLISKAPEMLEMLETCKLQLEYLNQKFGETGTTNSLLPRLETLINEATEL